ncbi:MAG: VC2046/SO_2500 family protein [Succinivibrionaceae bacterium]
MNSLVEREMLTSDIRNKFLVDELQLGNTLNEAVSNGDRAYFSLLLSMISNDVTDNASVVDPQKNKVSNEDLRAKFHLLEPRSFYATDEDYEIAEGYNTCLANGNISDINLTICMKHEPFAVKDEEIPNNILNNLSPLQRNKAECAMNGLSIAREPFDLCTLSIVEAIDNARNLDI